MCISDRFKGRRAVAKMKIRRGKGHLTQLVVEKCCIFQYIFHFAAICTRIHIYAAAYTAWDAIGKLQPRKAGLCRRQTYMRQQGTGAGCHSTAVHLNIPQLGANLNHDAFISFIGKQHV